MLITDQVDTAPCTDLIQVWHPTLEASCAASLDGDLRCYAISEGGKSPGKDRPWRRPLCAVQQTARAHEQQACCRA